MQYVQHLSSFALTLPECKLGSATCTLAVPLSLSSTLMWDTALLHSSVSVFTHGWAISVGFLNIMWQHQKYWCPTLQTWNHTNFCIHFIFYHWQTIIEDWEVHLILQGSVPFTNFWNRWYEAWFNFSMFVLIRRLRHIHVYTYPHCKICP